MSKLTATERTELDHWSSESLDVTLMWVTGSGIDQSVVCVRDKRDGTYFELAAEPYLALDVFYDPLAYEDLTSVRTTDDRLAA